LDKRAGQFKGSGNKELQNRDWCDRVVIATPEGLQAVSG
jgi:hypothetical protein